MSNTNDFTANPAPLGLCGFGMTTMLLNLHNSGLFGLDTSIVAMGIFYGGMAQIIAGIMEWKKGNTFATTAFTSYGFFWLTLVAIWYLPQISKVETITPMGFGLYLSLWGFFTFCLFIGTLRLTCALKTVFATLTILFALLAISTFTGNACLHTVAGYVGIFCGFSAFYTAMAQVLNEVYGRTILPLYFCKKCQ